MGRFWTWLLARFAPKNLVSPEESAARVAAVVEHMKAQELLCLRVVTAAEPTGSALGGAPSLPAGQSWPRSDGAPLSFVARLDLAEIRSAGGPEWLPESGELLFFFDASDLDAWSVVHTPRAAETAPATPPSALAKKCRFAERPVRFEAYRSYPLYDRSWHLVDDFTQDELEQIEHDLSFVEQAEPVHQLGGYPRPIQNDEMEAECQSDSERESMVEDWRLLLQLDSDEQMGSNWGDGGTIYFWVREQDARAGDFSHVRAIAQFY